VLTFRAVAVRHRERVRVLSDCLEEEVFEELIFSDGEDENEHEFDTASDVGAGSECSAVHEIKAGTIVPVPLTRVDEAQGSARQCGSGIANTTQVSRSGKPKYHSNMPGRQSTDPLPVCEGVIEWNSNDGTYGEIAWSPEPHEGSEFIDSNAAEVLRNTTCGREVSQIFPALCRREMLNLDELTSEVSNGAVQLRDVQISGTPLTTFRGVSDAQATDTRQTASVLRALEEEGNTTASARSYATQSSGLLDPRCDWTSGGSEPSHFEDEPVTTYRQVYNIQASQAFMPGSALDATRGGCELSVRLLESVNVKIWGGTTRCIVRGLEVTPVGGYSGAVTSISMGAKKVSIHLGHLPVEGRDRVLKCCAGLAERGLGIGQLGLQEPLRSGVAEYFLSLKICEWSSGSTSISVAGGAPYAVGLMASKGRCRPAESQDEIRCVVVVGESGCKVLRSQHGYSDLGDLRPAREEEHLEVQHEKKSIIQCDDRLRISAGDAERSVLHEAVLCERCSSTSAGVGNLDTPRTKAECLVEEDGLATTKRQVHLVHPEHALDQVSAHADRSDAESLICIDALFGGEPQRNVTSVECTPGVLASSSKWVQGVSSGDGHEPAKGSDLSTFYCGDRLAERNLDARQFELESHTSLRKRSCGTQAARRSSAAHDASTRHGRLDYSEWTSSGDQGLDAAPLDRHGGRPEGAVYVKVFDPGGRIVCRV